MKASLLISIFVSLTAAPSAFAGACAFGTESVSYETMVDKNGEALFRLSERISFLHQERANGLLQTEREALLKHFSGKGIATEEEAIGEMLADEGYITRLSGGYAMNFAKFIIIATYPGDNEYGAIYKLDNEGKAAEKVADIGDGEISNCTVEIPE